MSEPKSIKLSKILNMRGNCCHQVWIIGFETSDTSRAIEFAFFVKIWIERVSKQIYIHL